MDAVSAAAVFAQGSDILQGKRVLKDARGIPDEAIKGLYGVVHELYTGGNYREALQGFELLCLYDHENPEYWMGLGYCRQMLGDPGGAATALSYATTHMKAHDWELYYNIAQCFAAVGHKAMADIYVDAILASTEAAADVKDKAHSLQARLAPRAVGEN